MASSSTALARHRGRLAVTFIQAACAVYFMFDIASELPAPEANSLHVVPEAVVLAVLCVGTALGIREINSVLQQNQRMAGRLRAASGAFLDLLEESFARWGLTPSERDVALLAVKGLSIGEIARIRATREGTVKAQCAAVYRKAGVSGRAQLLSLFIEDLMAGVVLEPGASGRVVVATQHGGD